MNTMETKGLSAGSLYKLFFIGLLIPLGLFGLGCGIASFFGYSTVYLNDAYVFGFKGLIVGAIIGVILPALMSAFLWVIMGFGLWVWTRVSTITLSIKS